METQDMGESVTVRHASASGPLTNGSAPSPDLLHHSAPSPNNSQNGRAQPSPLTDQRASKIAACLSCRRSKVRCEKGADPVRCRRCAQTGGDCVRPTFNVGRRKGVKNKRKGLEKALYQVEEALKRAGPGVQSTDAGRAITELKTMLATGGEAQLNGSVESHKRPRLATTCSSEPRDSSSDEEESPGPPRSRKESGGARRGSMISQRHVKPEERLAVDDAENPLQLLARASNLHLSPDSTQDQSPGAAASLYPASSVHDDDPEMRQVRYFFGTTHFNVDQGDDYDPIDLGLVTEEEAEMLFDFFHKNLSHTRWGLDPIVYTVPWTRNRSPFLFTTIMAASALFIESASALSKRLSKHCKTLAQKVIEKRHRSTEIVLAFMINVPWMGPGLHSTDDETCWYVSLATTIALDLQMPKVNMPAEAFKNGALDGLARQDCLDPELALRSGGFKDVDPNSELGRRLVRRRERCWLALFVLERGMCLARGRTYTVPMTPMIQRCDRWHISDIADSSDGALVSMAVLRRDLDGIFDTIRSLCDGSREGLTDGALIARSIQSTVDKFFEQWYLEWGQTIGTGPQNRVPPYVEILVTHTRLSIYSSVINHPTAPLEARQFFRTASLSAALNVMRAAVQGEPQLFSMPNNTAIMVSFAACFALRLSAQLAGAAVTSSALAPSVRTLIEETADVLGRIGNITRHRNGISALYAKYLRILVKKAAAETGAGNGAGGAGVGVGGSLAGLLARGPGGGHVGGEMGSTPRMTHGQVYADSAAAAARRGGAGGSLAYATAPAGGGNNNNSSSSTGRKTGSTPSSGGLGFGSMPPANTLSPFDAGVPAWSSTATGATANNQAADLFPFSSMSGDQIIEALNRAGTDLDTAAGYGSGMGGTGGGGGGGGAGAGGGFTWDDGGAFDWMPQWSNWPDFGF